MRKFICISCMTIFLLASCNIPKTYTFSNATPTPTRLPILGILRELNQWDKEELDVLECSNSYPNRLPADDTSGWVTFHKRRLRDLGVYVRWNCKAKAYEFTTIDDLTPECGC